MSNDLHFSCPSCQQRFVVSGEGIGQQITCPNCSNNLTIPSANTAFLWKLALVLFFIDALFLLFFRCVKYEFPPILAWIVLLPAYFLPTIIGIRNRNNLAIFILNLLLGWTVVGWIGSLIWAVVKAPDGNEENSQFVKLIYNRWILATTGVCVCFICEVIYFLLHVNKIYFDPLLLEVGIGGFLIALIIGGLYMLPTIIGIRGSNALIIFILNYFLGWTGIIWICLLVYTIWTSSRKKTND